MGFWGKLGHGLESVGKVALKAAPLIAAPFTGGASLWALPAIGAASGAIGNAIDHKNPLTGALMGGAEGIGTYGASKFLGGLGGLGGAASDTGGSMAGNGVNDTIDKLMGSGGKSSLLGKIGGYLGKNPTLPLAALSLIGKDYPPYQMKKSFKGPMTSPENALNGAMSALYRSGQAFTERPNTTLKGLLPPAPNPVNIPGLGFQIGGGMGHNPAMDDQEVDNSWLDKYDPFQSVAQGQFDSAKKRSI